MSRRIFSIDLGRCTGCFACAVACHDRADMPDDGAWLRVECQEKGLFPKPHLAYRVVHCFHCANPSCIPVCPADAITQQPDGLVQINAQACVGCGACSEACPFGAIHLSADGIATKCDGCADEISRGREPTCVRACPMRALDYGLAPNQPTRRKRDADFEEHGIAPAVVYWVVCEETVIGSDREEV